MGTATRPSRAPPDRPPNYDTVVLQYVSTVSPSLSQPHEPPQLPRFDHGASSYRSLSPRNSQANPYISRSPVPSSHAIYGHSDPYQPLSRNNSQFRDGSLHEYDLNATLPESPSLEPNGVPRSPTVTTRTQRV